MILKVYKEDFLVGEVYTSDEGVCFTYSQDYLSKGALPLSLALPLSAKAYPQSAVLPFFDGLLPEGEQRQDLGKLLHVSSTSTIKLLQALAGECIGNLIIVAEEANIVDLLQESAYTPLSSKELEALLRPQSIERINFIIDRRLSLAGAQAKFGLFYESGEWFATKGLAPTTHIIKPASLLYPSLLINEFFMMRLAGSCGVEVPATGIIHHGENFGFVVERFDRQRLGDRIVRVGQEDFCQALSIMPNEKYEDDGGPGFKELFATTLNNTYPPTQNIRRLLRMAMFNYLIGNCDAHAKNYSLLQDHKNGRLSLAPAYDLVSTTYYADRLLRTLAMRIGKHSRIDRINAEDFGRFSEEIGVSLAAITTELDTLHELLVIHLDKIVETIGQEAEGFLPIAGQLREHLLRELEQRVVL